MRQSFQSRQFRIDGSKLIKTVSFKVLKVQVAEEKRREDNTAQAEQTHTTAAPKPRPSPLAKKVLCNLAGVEGALGADVDVGVDVKDGTGRKKKETGQNPQRRLRRAREKGRRSLATKSINKGLKTGRSASG
jgi:hypothetical protein